MPPLSYQGWEYTGVWAPSRDAAARDVMANATVSGTVGVLELAPEVAPVRRVLELSPNPASDLVTVRFARSAGTAQTLELYNAAGTVVRTSEVRDERVVLDTRQIPAGVYFVRVKNSDYSVAKLVIQR